MNQVKPVINNEAANVLFEAGFAFVKTDMIIW